MTDLIVFKHYLLEIDRTDCTLLHLGADNENLAVIRRLLRVGINAESRDLLDFTALNYTIDTGVWDVVKELRNKTV
jgi:hypothetical protein